MKPLKVKIKVVDRKSSDEVADKYPFPPYFKPGQCEKFKDGEEFVIFLGAEMPEDFPCGYAWESLMVYYPWLIKQIAKYDAVEGTYNIVPAEYPCCVDGLKPVTFEMRLLNEDEE